MFYQLHRRKTFRSAPLPPVTLGYVDNENSYLNYSFLNDLNAVTLSYVNNFVYSNDINQTNLGYVDINVSSLKDLNQITVGYVDIDTEAVSDYPPVTLSVSPNSVAENSGTNIVYTFTRASDPGLPITINYLVGGTANSFDYTGTSPGLNTIILSSGTSTTLTITPSPDLVNEPNDTVEITLQAGVGYTVGTATPVISTIINDD